MPLKKHLGQHLLTDRWVIADIIAALRLQPDDRLVEIGPGQGALTAPLLPKIKHLYAIELDAEMVHYLQQHLVADNLTVLTGNALTFDFTQLPLCRLVGNLPYYITSALLFHCTQQQTQFVDWHCLLQHEVALRLVANPGHKNYGRLSVMMQYHHHIDLLFTVPATAFQPAPQVQSALVRLVSRRERHAQDETLFAWLVQRAFGQRRKMLRHVFKTAFASDHLNACALSPQSRAESLSVQDFVRLSNHLSAQGWSPPGVAHGTIHHR